MNFHNSQQILTNNHQSTSETDWRTTSERCRQTTPSRSFRTVTSYCSRFSRLQAKIDAEEEITEQEKKLEKFKEKEN
jgi:hypothetical protein